LDFGFSDEQSSLRSSFGEFLAGETPVAHARAMLEDPCGTTAAVWQSFARLGWLGLNTPTEYGGSGLGSLETVLVMEESGAVVLPGPFFSTLSLAVPAVLACGNEEQRRRWLPAITRGHERLTVAWCESDGRWGPQAVTSNAREQAGGFRVRGHKLFVPDAGAADAVIVPARLEGEVAMFVVPQSCEGLKARAMKTIDGTRKLFELTVDCVLERDALLGGKVGEQGVLELLLARARSGIAAEMAGCARRALEMSVEYAKVREQFGRPIGSFQAVQHTCANMNVGLQNSLSLIYYAGWSLDHDAAKAPLATAMAKAYASEACMKVCSDAVQVHGGIGFTWEHDMHLYFKRVRGGMAAYGDATENREMVARSLSL